MFTVLNLAIAVPLFLAGLAADTFGLNLVVVMMGIVLLTVGLVSARGLLRVDWQARRGGPDQVP